MSHQSNRYVMTIQLSDWNENDDAQSIMWGLSLSAHMRMTLKINNLICQWSSHNKTQTACICNNNDNILIFPISFNMHFKTETLRNWNKLTIYFLKQAVQGWVRLCHFEFSDNQIIYGIMNIRHVCRAKVNPQNLLDHPQNVFRVKGYVPFIFTVKWRKTTELQSVSWLGIYIQPESTVRISARELPFLCHPMRSYDALRKVSWYVPPAHC